MMNDVLSGKRAWYVEEGDALPTLRTLPDGSVHCVVTSPPYYRLRDYGHPAQIGLERTPGDFVRRLVEVFEDVRRVLREDGTCWVNIGDSYSSSGRGQVSDKSTLAGVQGAVPKARKVYASARKMPTRCVPGIERKQLLGVPWRLAFALQDAGWFIRSAIIWHKTQPFPENVNDRPTRSYEHVFLLSRSKRYFYDAAAVARPSNWKVDGGTSNLRDVWTIGTEQFEGGHFATMPKELARRAVLAGCPKDGVVLDPFAGAATVGVVATRHDRRFIGIELNPEYAALARQRIEDDAPLFHGRSTTNTERTTAE